MSENLDWGEMQLPAEVLQNTIDFLVANILEASSQPDFAHRDLLADCEIEDQTPGFMYPVPSRVIGDILAVDTTNASDPYLIVGNVVHYTELDEDVRTVLSVHDIESIPLICIGDPFITNHWRKGSCSGDSWHKDYFPSTD